MSLPITKKNLTQAQIILNSIIELGRVATIKEITAHALDPKKTDFAKICQSKTPDANIRRILQLTKNIYKIKPGLYSSEPMQKKVD